MGAVWFIVFLHLNLPNIFAVERQQGNLKNPVSSNNQTKRDLLHHRCVISRPEQQHPFSMANKTDTYALHSRGTDPQNLLEPSFRHSVYLSRFWNESCFGVNLADVVPLAARLDRVSAMATPATPFLCLLLKLLQLSPEEPEIVEYLTQTDFKYARVLAAFYVRLAMPPERVYALLEPLLADFRKIVIKEGPSAEHVVIHVDELIDRLLREHLVVGITLPRLPPRHVIEESFVKLPPRPQLLEGL